MGVTCLWPGDWRRRAMREPSRMRVWRVVSGAWHRVENWTGGRAGSRLGAVGGQTTKSCPGSVCASKPARIVNPAVTRSRSVSWPRQSRTAPKNTSATARGHFCSPWDLDTGSTDAFSPRPRPPPRRSEPDRALGRNVRCGSRHSECRADGSRHCGVFFVSQNLKGLGMIAPAILVFLGVAAGVQEKAFREDEVDTPAVVTRMAQPRYHPLLLHVHVEPTATVTFVIDTAGRIESGSLELSLSNEHIRDDVREALLQFAYKPAYLAGSPVRQRASMEIQFIDCRPTEPLWPKNKEICSKHAGLTALYYKREIPR